MDLLRSIARSVVPAPIRRLLRSTASPAPAPPPHGHAHLDRPNRPEEWEREYLTEVRPITTVGDPVAKAVASVSQPGDVLLEAGCGAANLSAELAIVGRRIELADFSERILERAKQVFAASNLPVPGTTLCDLTKFPYPWTNKSVDIVWSSGVLEHWTDDDIVLVLREMARLARKRVVSLIPYAGSMFYRFGKWQAERAGTWLWGREIPRSTLRNLYNTAGMTDVRESTVWDAQAVEFLNFVDPKACDLAREWWATLAEDDPVRRDQGYLLMTVGEVTRRVNA